MRHKPYPMSFKFFQVLKFCTMQVLLDSNFVHHNILQHCLELLKQRNGSCQQERLSLWVIFCFAHCSVVEQCEGIFA